jgi:hypothetical protein
LQRKRESRRRRGESGELTGGVDGRNWRNPKTPKHLRPFSGETQKPQNISSPTTIVGSTGVEQPIGKEKKKKMLLGLLELGNPSARKKGRNVGGERNLVY